MKKGITATSVVIMVVVIMILVGTITTFSYNSIENARKIAFSLEISNLQEAVNNYITDSAEGDYPILGNEYLIDLTDVSDNSISQFNGETKNTNDEITVYEIDLSILGITDIVYGNKKTEKDVYVVSKTTDRVYYIEGIKSKNVTYYTLTEDLLDLNKKNEKQEEQVTSKTPIISTDGFVIKTLTDDTEEIYLSNIKVKNSPKIFKYEIGIISENVAKDYFKSNGKTVTSDRIKLENKSDMTLYAENEIGEYNILYCTKAHGVLQVNAKNAIDAGIKIGDTVTGYTLDTSAAKKTYTTSGKENTAPNVSGAKDVVQTPTPQGNLQRIEYTTWKYIGIGKNGEVLIAPDMVSSVSDNQKIQLSGKGGFVNGPAELNNMCKALYSTSKGTARSMDVEDINRILNYTGLKGRYIDESGEEVITTEAKRISEIGTLTYTETPDGNPIGDYYSDWFFILPTSDEISATDEVKSFVYTSDGYFLASMCTAARLDSGTAGFEAIYVSSGVYNLDLYKSNGYSFGVIKTVRPVVALNSDVTLTKQVNGSWNI